MTLQYRIISDPGSIYSGLTPSGWPAGCASAGSGKSRIGADCRNRIGPDGANSFEKRYFDTIITPFRIATASIHTTTKWCHVRHDTPDPKIISHFSFGSHHGHYGDPVFTLHGSGTGGDQ